MHGSRATIDVTAGGAEDCLTMHGYWLPAAVVRQDSTRYSDDTNSSGSVNVLRERGAISEMVAQAPARGPLVEDDDEDDVHAGDYFLDQCSSGRHSHAAASRQSSIADGSATPGAVNATPAPFSEAQPVPFVEEEALGDLGDIIGYGGDRGSLVYRVTAPALLDVLQQQTPSFSPPLSLGSPLHREHEAYKRYPAQLSQEELSFVSTAYRCASDSAHCQTARSPLVTAEEAQYAALHLVLPDAVVTKDRIKVGLLMPLYNCSLKQFLQGFSLADHERGTSSVDSRVPSSCLDENTFCSEEGGAEPGAFNNVVKYRPVESMEVVSSIAFQVLEAIAYLNHRLPHGASASGYTHNDLHLDNVLLSYEGDVALCDFELVASTPHTTHSGEVRRLPPSTRRSPHGLYSETADTWAFGLMLTGLLTGVDPLFTNNIVNDFSDGPQLSHWDCSECVLDWESNIRSHVEGLLWGQDPTGRRLTEAQEILNVCSKCLVNRKDAEPLRALDLLEEPLFEVYRKDFHRASKIIKQWTSSKC